MTIGYKERWKVINLLSIIFVFSIAFYIMAVQVSGMIASDVGLHMIYADKFMKGEH